MKKLKLDALNLNVATFEPVARFSEVPRAQRLTGVQCSFPISGAACTYPHVSCAVQCPLI